MKTRQVPVLIVLLALSSSVVATFAQGTAFTYQGQLTEGGNPANGLYDFRFSVMESPDLGVPLDLRTTNGVSVNHGLFTVALDFGSELFDGSPRWLEIEVKTNNAAGSYTLLSPRQELTAAPYAILAGNISGALSGTGLTGTYSSPVTLDNAANLFTGNFTGNGGELTNVNAGTLEGLSAAGFWRVSGNADTSPGTHFLGTIDSQPLNVRVNNVRALRLEPTLGAPNVIGGAEDNMTGEGVTGATIGGGTANAVGGSYGTVGGGEHNTASSPWTTIGGGDWNFAAFDDAAVGGGYNNSAVGYVATVSGGWQNSATNDHAYVGGGRWNVAGGLTATISGGQHNLAFGRAASIGGGTDNTIQTNADSSTIGGGWWNTIQAYSGSSTVGGGYLNTIEPNTSYATIGGGRNNMIQTNAEYSTIGGGDYNTIQTNADSSTIGGGEYNAIHTNAFASTISGGRHNEIHPNAARSTVSGGYVNKIQRDAFSSTIGGGDGNTAYGIYTVIGGGRENVTTNHYATISGGYLNQAHWRASVGGGLQNVASGDYATVPGGAKNLAGGAYSFAAGNQAQATNSGAFVWADNSSTSPFYSTANNEASFRCAGGVRFTSATGGGNQTVAWTPGSGSWSFTSDRNTKRNLHAVNAPVVLERVSRLPLHEWNYVGYGQRHLGPMAQDFHRAFPWSGDAFTLNSADLDGVALAAIQGLNQKVEDGAQKSEARIQKLEALNAKLRARLEKLEQLLKEKLDGGVQ